MPQPGALPLVLTPFEEYMFRDDRPAYPMCGFFRLRFSGRFDRAILRFALEVAQARHPLLSARVRLRGCRPPEWVSTGPGRAVLDWGDLPGRTPGSAGAHLDLRRGVGLRLHVTESEGASDLLLQNHHACCDGGGLLSFAEDLLVAYAAAIDGRASESALKRLDASRLAQRGLFGGSRLDLYRNGLAQPSALIGIRDFLTRRATPLLPHRSAPPDGPLPEPYPALRHVVLGETETARLRSSSRRLGTTLNTVLLRDLLTAVHRFRTLSGVDAGWNKVAVPIDLRTEADRETPAANILSFAFIERRGADLADPDRLLESLDQQMWVIQKQRLGLTFVAALDAVRYVPGLLSWRSASDLCRATFVLSNLGELFGLLPLPRLEDRFQVGNLVLDEVQMLPPIRPSTTVAFGATIYAGRLTLALHYDSRVLSEEQADRLLRMCQDRIEQSGLSRPVPHIAER